MPPPQDCFRQWLVHPNILPVLKQLIGAPPTFECCHAMIKSPHVHRHDPERREEMLDHANFGWHRGIRPKWGIVESDRKGFLNTTFMNNITFLTDVEDELDGGTAVMSGSHVIDHGEGKDGWQPLISSAERITGIKAGDVVHFTEAMIHSGVPVLSECTRYTMFYGLTPPWMRTWINSGPDPAIVDSLPDGELKEILASPHPYGGQYSKDDSRTRTGRAAAAKL